MQRQDQVDTLIPLLYMQYGTLEASVEHAVRMIDDAIVSFDKTASQLENRYRDDPEVLSGLQKFIHACRCACTANLSWRSESQRCLH